MLLNDESEKRISSEMDGALSV